MSRIVLNTVILVLIFFYSATAEKKLKLPSYIKPCSRSAPDFDDCALKHAIEAFPTFLKGDKEYYIPPLNPLVLPSVEVEASGFKITFQDLHVYGLDRAQLKQIKFDLNKKEIHLKAFFDTINLVGKYNCDGKILILPLQGNGDINITIVGLDIKYDVNYNVVEVDGEEYVSFPDEADVDYTITKVHFDIQGLFNENKELSDATVKALNDEWEKFAEALKPIITQTIVSVGQGVAGGFVSNIPINVIFAD